jgi:hypothetical protein
MPQDLANFARFSCKIYSRKAIIF